MRIKVFLLFLSLNRTDLWCDCTVLSQRFPHLYGMAAHTNGTVEEMWDQNVGQGDWDLRFVRGFNDWELDMVGNLIDVLRGYKPTSEEDAVYWKGGRMDSLKSRKLTTWWLIPWLTTFRKVTFGWIKFQLKFCFLLGRPLGGRCLR